MDILFKKKTFKTSVKVNIPFYGVVYYILVIFY